MLYNIVLVVHVIVALVLIGVILIQRGRSGGLVEALGGVESIFGTKTNSFFVKATVFLAVCFFLTSISLAYLSKQKGKSLMGNYKEEPVTQQQQAEPVVSQEKNQELPQNQQEPILPNNEEK